jgi:hypothetical protein
MAEVYLGRPHRVSEGTLGLTKVKEPPFQIPLRPPRAEYLVVRIGVGAADHLCTCSRDCICARLRGGRQISSSAPRLEHEGMARFYGIVSGRGRTTKWRLGRKFTGFADRR